MLRKLLQQQFGNSIQINEAVSGNIAIQTMGFLTPDLVITDWKMENGNGEDVVKYCLKEKIKVFIYTGTYYEEMKPYEDILVWKPDLNGLIQKISDFLEKKN